MPQRVIIGALLIVLGAFLGGTFLRDQVASARSLANAVIVANGPAQPVPVRERGTAKVRVTNAALPVVLGAPTDRFGKHWGFVWPFTCLGCDQATLLTVPQGKVAVIEVVSAQLNVSPGGTPSVGLWAESDTEPEIWNHSLGFASAGHSGGNEVICANDAVRLYVPAGARLKVGASLSSSGQGAGLVNVSGYLLPAP